MKALAARARDLSRRLLASEERRCAGGVSLSKAPGTTAIFRREVFPLIYRTILGQERGPRLVAFIRLAPPARVVRILGEALGRG